MIEVIFAPVVFLQPADLLLAGLLHDGELVDAAIECVRDETDAQGVTLEITHL